MYVRLARLRRVHGTTSFADRCILDTFYFDRDDWAIRALSLRNEEAPQAGGMIASPLQVQTVDVQHERLDVSLQAAPYLLEPHSSHRVFSSKQTADLHEYYELPPFWDGVRAWGDASSPGELMKVAAGHVVAVPVGREADERFATARTLVAAGRRREERRPQTAYGASVSCAPVLYPHTQIMGRPVFSPDGRLGAVSDLLIDVDTWRIRYLIVRVQVPGESAEVLLSPFWVNGPPPTGRMTVAITTEAILNGPNFAAEELQPLDEQILARYFGFLTE